MKKKSLSILIAVALASTSILPAASVFADTTTTPVTAPTPVTSAPASTYGVEYEGQVQNIGWQTPVTTTGDASAITTAPIAGTVNKGLRVEALKVTGTNLPAGASITYQGQVQNVGWQTPVTTTGNADIATAAIAGTVNKGLRVEGFKMTLNGLPGYAIEYQTQIQNIGWQAAVQTTNGADISTAALSGTQNKGLRLEALRVELVKTTAEKTSEVSAINAVQTAEASGLAADITAAKAAVTLVQDTAENTALTARINALTISVSSIKAASAKSFDVTLSSAPADTSKLSFTVMNGTNPVSITPTWSTDGTVATLTTTSNLPAATYTVDVKNGTTDLGTTSVTVSDQKVGSIKITSTKLGVNGTGTAQVGYASYVVYDQYGNDVTTTSLGNDLTFNTGVGDITTKNGEIKITPSSNINLLTMSTVVISAYDSTTGTSTQATLTTTSQMGTLSSLTFGTALTNADGKVLTAGDSTDIFYLPFTATDISGNPTSNYDLIKNGIITNKNANGLTDCLTSSNSDVTAQIVKDPNNSSNAVIQVTDNGNTISSDSPIVINASTWGSGSATFNVTLKKQAQLATFKLQSPVQDVALNDTETTIPFTALDQNGKTLTQFSDLTGKVSFSNGVTLVANADGTASVKLAGPFSSTGTQTITANVTSGGADSNSTLSINIQKAWKADSLALDSTKLLNSMQNGATTKIDFGFDKGGLSVNDQYDRLVNMTQNYGNYEVVATSSNPSVISVSDTNNDATPAAYGGSALFVNASPTATGSATITFELIDKSLPVASQVIDTKAETISVQTSTNITGYAIETVPDPIYASTSGVRAADTTDYQANPAVYGTTASGSRVKLAESNTKTIVSASVDNPTDFKVTTDGTAENVFVQALTPQNNASTSKTTLTVTVMGVDGTDHTVKTPITSSTAAPIASSLDIDVENQNPGLSLASNGNDVTIDTSKADLTADGLVAGDYLTKFTPGMSGVATAQKIYFKPIDQYGAKDTDLDSINQTSSSDGKQYFATDGSGKLILTPAAGVTISVTGSANGHLKAINLIFMSSGTPIVTTVDKTALTAEIGTVNGLTASSYTAATWATLQAALTTANTDVASTSATQTVIDADTAALKADVSNLALAGNTLSGVYASGMYGKSVTITVPDGTKVTAVTDGTNTLSAANYDYGISGNVVTVNVTSNTDVLTVTDAGTTYNVVVK